MAVVAFLAMVVFIVQFGISLADVPSTRLLEDAICRNYYGNYGNYSRGELLDESRCQAEPVQAELNVVSTGLLISQFIPGIFVALPFGALADRWGRKLVLSLCLGGLILSNLWFAVMTWTWEAGSIRRVWSSSLLLLIGGGNSVAEAMVFALVADLSNDSNRYVVAGHHWSSGSGSGSGSGR